MVALAILLVAFPRELRAEVTAEITALGDDGRAFIGQPVYADALYKNPTARAVTLSAGGMADRWEFRDSAAGAPQACSPRIRTSGTRVAGSAEPVVWLKPGESRSEQEIILDLVCANLPRRAGRVWIRVRLEGIEQSAASAWRSLDLVTPTGKEAEAIAAAPQANGDLEGFLKRFGDTAVAAPFLRDLNEIEARGDWTSNRAFADRVRALSANARWTKSVGEWRLRATVDFLRGHPNSYFAPELNTEVGAMYATRGDAAGVERAATALSRTDPARAAEVNAVARAMRSGTGSER